MERFDRDRLIQLPSNGQRADHTGAGRYLREHSGCHRICQRPGRPGDHIDPDRVEEGRLAGLRLQRRGRGPSLGHSQGRDLARRGPGIRWHPLVLVVILSVGGGFTRWGRIAVPVALIALIRLNGYASLRGSLTLLWFVPLPHFINTLVWPELILFYSQAVAGLRISLEATSVFIQSGEGGLRLSQGDAGMALMVALGGVSYFVSWQRDESASRTTTRLLFSVLAALPLQFLAIALALLLLKSGFPQPAQTLVNVTIWVVSLAWILIFVPGDTWRPPKKVRG